MNKLLFGTGGSPLSSAPPRSTIQGIQRIAELGLDCMELEFVHGVRMSEEVARKVREVAVAGGVTLTSHAPYYINLNSREPDKLRASQDRLLKTVQIGSLEFKLMK
jgi:deoxyribonuclease IV